MKIDITKTQILFENETKCAILNQTKVKLSSAYKLLCLYPFHRKEIKREIFAIQSFENIIKFKWQNFFLELFYQFIFILFLPLQNSNFRQNRLYSYV
jgi:hypothetical protein